ncbi:MAG: hypothetical protein HY074_12775 [Deltaproteobacteria bacterium]|nr:hypothetical protein [Deltaproteobacteria bacterium]
MKRRIVRMVFGPPSTQAKALKRALLAGLAAWLFAFAHNGGASECADLLLLPGSPAIIESFSAYLSSTSPDFETVKALLGSLEFIDTSDAQVQQRLKPVTTQLQLWANRLATEAPLTSATPADLQAASNKLRLLNTPALRNLLGDAALQSLVGRAAWVYNRAIWDASLDRPAKITAIAEGLKAPLAAAAATPSESSPPPARAVNVKVVTGDVMTAKASAVVATIECDGLCGSKINASLRPYVTKAIQGRTLADGQTLTVFDSHSNPEASRNFVLIVDDQKLPLNIIVTRALLEAEKSGFTSVVLPALRTGYAFGSVEISYEQVVAEIKAGVARFAGESRGTLTDISIAVRNDGPLTACAVHRVHSADDRA